MWLTSRVCVSVKLLHTHSTNHSHFRLWFIVRIIYVILEKIVGLCVDSENSSISSSENWIKSCTDFNSNRLEKK